MIAATLRAQHPLLAEKLRDISEETLSDPLGDAHIDLAYACKLARYDLGEAYLFAVAAKHRAHRPGAWTHIVLSILANIRLDALKVPPKGLEEEMRGLVSPRLAGLAA